MGKSYASDLPDRVVGFVEAGGSRRGAARHFGVSNSFAVKLLLRSKRFGSSQPARQGRPPGKGKLAPHRAFLVGLVEERGGASFREGSYVDIVGVTGSIPVTPAIRLP